MGPENRQILLLNPLALGEGFSLASAAGDAGRLALPSTACLCRGCYETLCSATTHRWSNFRVADNSPTLNSVSVLIGERSNCFIKSGTIGQRYTYPRDASIRYVCVHDVACPGVADLRLRPSLACGCHSGHSFCPSTMGRSSHRELPCRVSHCLPVRRFSNLEIDA
jgi:hypothetical protein